MAGLADEARWDLPLRLLAAVHYLALSGVEPDAFDAWERFSAVLDEHAEFLRRFIAERPIQTNEVQRSWVLLPCFLEIARRTGARTFDLLELGPSAGLNLVWDRYRYRYAAGAWGPEEAGLELGGDERRPVPAALLERRIAVRHRVGIDRNPVDVTKEKGALLLKSFVWADQRDRLQRLDAAIEALRADPPELVEGDFVALLPDRLAKRRDGALTVVFQTAVLIYLDEAARERVRASLEEAGRSDPLALVSAAEPREAGATHWGLSVRVWPGGEHEPVAEADYHGAWIEWA